MSYQLGDFVDRDQTLNTIRKMVAHKKPRILHLLGPQGDGKSYMLKEFREECRRKNTAHVWIDFAETSSDTSYRDISRRISAELGPEDFEIFDATADDARRLINLIMGAISGRGDGNGGPRGSVEQNFTNVVADMIAAGDITITKIGTLNIGQIKFPEGVRVADDGVLTTALQASLFQAAARQDIVFFIDHWDEASTQTQNWLRDNLLDWLIENRLKNAVAIIAARSAPALAPSKAFNTSVERLPALERDDVRQYWVKKRGFADNLVDDVYRASNGLPGTVKILADCWGANPGAQFWNKPSVRCVVRALESQREAVAQGVRLGAIPHWLDTSLLAELMGPPGTAELKVEVADFLTARSWAQEDPQQPGRFQYDVQIRGILLDYWREDCPDDYAEVNQKLAAYFHRLINDGEAADRASYEREMVYHQMLVNEDEGLALIRRHFEDAFEHYDLPRMEGLICKYREELGRLKPETVDWLNYYNARVDWVHGRGEPEAALKLLFNDHDLTLRGLARWTLGDVMARQGQWSKAIELYGESLDFFQSQSQPGYAARVKMALGTTYCDIADQNGRIPVESGEILGIRVPWLMQAENLPATAYRLLIRRIPSRLLPPGYAGTNYQDWILTELRKSASNWYFDAQQQFPGEDAQVAQALLNISQIEHQLGRWSLARRGYGQLSKQDPKGNTYRVVLIHLGQGRASLSEGRWDEAQNTLTDVLRDFEQCSDLRSAAVTAELLGQCCSRLKQYTEAGEHFLKSVQLFDLTGNALERTHAIWQLEETAPSVPEAQRQQIETYIDQIPERHYVTRFSAELLRTFRQLAVLRTLPLTYLLACAVSLAMLLLLMVAESDIRYPGPLSFRDAVWHIMLIVLPLPLSLWMYRIIYSLMGVSEARKQVKRLGPVERAPRRLVTDNEGIRFYEVYERGAAPSQTMRWEDITCFLTAATKQRAQRIDFLSRLILDDGKGKPLVIEGITTGFDHLIRDIEDRLSRAGKGITQRPQNFVIFDGRWLLGAVVGVIIYSLTLYLSGVLELEVRDPNVPGSATPIPVSAVMISFLPTLLLVLPTMILWRLTFYQHSLPEAAQQPFYKRHRWFFWVAAIFATFVAFLWIVGFPLPLID